MDADRAQTMTAEGRGEAVSRAAALPVAAAPEFGVPGVAPPHFAALAPPASAGGRLARGVEAIAGAAEAERGRGLAFLFVPVFLGIGSLIHFTLPADPPFEPLVLLLALAVALALVAARRASAATYPAVLLCAVLGGMVAGAIEARRGPTLLDSDVTTTVTGRVVAVEIDTGGAARYLLDLEATEEPAIRRQPERIRVSTRAATPAHPVGTRISGRARLARPSGPAFPGGFDFAFSAFTDGIGAYGFFFAAPQAVAGGAAPADPATRLSDRISGLRAGIAARIRAVVPGDAGGVAAALTVSDRRGISEPVAEALRATGLAHVLSISGLHMALAAGLSFVGLRRAMALSPRFAETLPVKKIAAVGALAVSATYFVISGGDVATKRAFLMMAILLGAAILDRAVLTMRNIAISALVVLLVEPSSVLSPGFQMSYAATAGLIAAYAAWSRWREKRGGGDPLLPRTGILRTLAAGLLGLAVTSLVAGLGSGMFAAYHFHRASFSGLLANLLAMPLVSFIVMPAGLAAMLAMPFGLDALPLKVMGLGIEGMIAVANGVARLGGEAVVGKPPTAAVLVATAGFIALVFLRGRLALAGAAVLVVGLVLMLPPFRAPPPRLLVGEDGNLVAVVSRAALATNTGRPPDFVFRQWQTAYGMRTHAPPQALGSAEAGADPAARLARLAAAAGGMPGHFVCEGRTLCVALVDGVRVATLGEPEMIGPACDAADLVVVSRPVRIPACRSGGILVTARTLRRTGALAIRILPDKPGGGDPAKPAENRNRRLVIETAVADVVRPWTMQRYYDWRSGRYELPGEAPAPVAVSGSGG